MSRFKIFLFTFMLGAAVILPADENLLLDEAIKNGLEQIRLLLLQKPRGATVVWLTLSNPFLEAEEYARTKIAELTPLFRGDGAINVLDSARARANANVQAGTFLTEDEGKELFEKLPGCDFVLLAKIDEEGNFSIQEASGDASLVSEVQFELDEEFFRLIDGYRKPFMPESSLVQLTGEINAIAYSSDYKIVFAGLKNGMIVKANAASKTILSNLREAGSKVNDLAIIDDYIFAATDTGLMLVNDQGETVFDAEASSNVVCTGATQLIIASFRGRISVFNTSGIKLMDFSDVRGTVKDMELSVDERTIYAIDDSGLVQWSVFNGERVKTFSGRYNALSVSPRADYIAVASNKEICFTDVNLQKKFSFLPAELGEADIRSLETSSNGLMLLCGASDGKIYSFLASSGKFVHTLNAHTASVNCLAYDNNDNFVSGSDDSRFGVWAGYREPSARMTLVNQLDTDAAVQINSGGVIYSVPSRQSVSIVVPIGTTAIEVIRPNTAVIDSRSFTSTLSFQQNENKRVLITNSPGFLDADDKNRLVPRLISFNNNQIYTAYYAQVPGLVGPLQARVSAWNLNGQYIQQGGNNEQHQRDITGIISTQDGNTYSVSNDHFIKVWKGGELVTTLDHGEAIEAVDVYGDFLLTSSFHDLKLWRRQNFELLLSIEEAGLAGFDHTGSIIAVRDDDNTLVRYALDGQQLPVVFPDEASPMINFSEPIIGLKRGHDKTIWVILANDTIQIRNTLAPFEIPGTCALFIRGMILTGNNDGSFGLFDAHNGRRLPGLGLPRHDRRVNDLAALSDNLFASAGEDGLIMTTDIINGRVLQKAYLYQDGTQMSIKRNNMFRGDDVHLVWRSGNTITTVPSYILSGSREN